MNVDANKLKAYLDSMDEEADARDRHSVQIREIVKRAKGDGFDTKALRKVHVRRRMDASVRQRDDDLLDIYEHALGAKGAALRAIEAGAPVGEAAKANDVHRATLARARNVAKQASNATPPHDPETGEVLTTAGEALVSSNVVAFDPSVPSTPTKTADLRDALNLAPDSAPERTQNERPAAAIADGEAVDVAIDARAASGSPTCGGGDARKATTPSDMDCAERQVAPAAFGSGVPQDNPEIGAEASIVVATADSSGPPTPLPPSEAAIGRRSTPKPISDEQAMDAMLSAHARLQASKRERECV